MSAVTVNISGSQLDLWTNITEWKPDQIFKNNQKSSMLSSELGDAFYAFQEDEIAQLERITSVSIPFAHWKGKNHKCPSKADPFPNANWRRGKNPDVFSRLVVPIEQAPPGYYSSAHNVNQHSDILKNIGYTLQQVCERASQLEGYRSRKFTTFIPLSCRSIADSITSLFPWTLMAKRFSGITPLHVLADFVTLPLRLITFGPRWLYQHRASNPTPPFKAAVIEGESIDWNSGALYLYPAAYGTGNPQNTSDGGSPNPRDYINCLRDSWRPISSQYFECDKSFYLG